MFLEFFFIHSISLSMCNNFYAKNGIIHQLRMMKYNFSWLHIVLLPIVLRAYYCRVIEMTIYTHKTLARLFQFIIKQVFTSQNYITVHSQTHIYIHELK